MPAGWKFEVMGRHIFCSKCVVEHAAIFRGNGLVILGVSEKSRRCTCRNLFLVGEELEQLRVGVLSKEVVPGALVALVSHSDDWIHENHEIGATTDALYRIG